MTGAGWIRSTNFDFGMGSGSPPNQTAKCMVALGMGSRPVWHRYDHMF